MCENDKIKTKCLLSLDVPTRWNLTYLMLDCTLKFVKAFVRLGEEDEHYKLIFVKQMELEKKAHWSS